MVFNQLILEATMADPSYAWTATVSEDFMGSLIIETESGNAYLQFQSDIDYFGKT